MNRETSSSLFILFATLLWGLDLVVRYPITLKMSYVSIVFIESMLGLIFILPWILKDGLQEFKKFSKKDWLLSVFIGGIGMSIAGYLSTLCIQKATPGMFSFFQIFQPFFVLYAARIFLKERIDNLYLYWGIWVVLSAVLMFSQDLELLIEGQLLVWSDVLIALLTMFIWGLCTIAGKMLLRNHRPISVVAVRWIFAFIFSSLIMFFEGESPKFGLLFEAQVLIRFIYISLIAGSFSMYFYYSGLKELPAGKVSYIELSFPAFGLIFSAIYTFNGLNFFQIVGAISFFSFIVLLLSRDNLRRGTAVPTR